MTTATDIISASLRLISSLTPGETIQGDEAVNALTVLNSMLASWSAEGFMIPFRTVESFSLVANQQSYTIGTGGNFNTIRPDIITNQWIHDTVSGLDYPVGIYTKEQYDAIPLKSIAAIPQWFYYDPQYPLGVIYLFPTSSVSSYQLTIESRKPIMQFALLTTAMALPGEYIKAIKYLLADELAPEYGFTIPQDMQQKIADSRKIIKRKNLNRVVATFDGGLCKQRVGNIVSGWLGW